MFHNPPNASSLKQTSMWFPSWPPEMLQFSITILSASANNRDHFVYMPHQRGMMLQCNGISHWLGAYMPNQREMTLHTILTPWHTNKSLPFIWRPTNGFQWLDFKTGHQDNSPSNAPWGNSSPSYGPVNRPLLTPLKPLYSYVPNALDNPPEWATQGGKDMTCTCTYTPLPVDFHNGGTHNLRRVYVAPVWTSSS